MIELKTTAFVQVANRCPLAILRRSSPREFKLAEITGKTVLMKPGGGASVGLFFKMLLRENRIDARSVGYIQDLDGKMLSDLFQGGMADYFITDNLSARAMASRNLNVSIAMEAVRQVTSPEACITTKLPKSRQSFSMLIGGSAMRLAKASTGCLNTMQMLSDLSLPSYSGLF